MRVTIIYTLILVLSSSVFSQEVSKRKQRKLLEERSVKMDTAKNVVDEVEVTDQVFNDSNFILLDAKQKNTFRLKR
ncbi:MAG: hypothetical protein KKH44_09065 [Bacteroidetes bacterium]|nr:hypothetical protein [Bacteroidota bacterium]